jgi:DNA-binding NtrC family response regulator
MSTTSVTRVLLRGGQKVRLVKTCVLEVLSGADARTRVRVEQPVFRIGSHVSNDLVVRESTVSRHHLELRIVDDGYQLCDLGSSNGTFLGSARIAELTVREPVTMTLGRIPVRLEPTDDETEVRAASADRFGRVLGRSVVMRELFERLESVAQADCALLLEGETGVGKELVARSVHEQSPRANGPFVVVDCAALPPDLLEAELFGWERGAFTGAVASRVGLLASADRGTIFLDEIGELAWPLQAKLLGALERRRVTPLGSTRARSIDVRVIAATNRNLTREMNRGCFRSDLFFRLAVVRLTVPPLRERLDDIPILVEAFLEELRARGRDAPELSAIALARLANRPWPGNVRELRNACERAVLNLVDRPPPPALPATAPAQGLFAARDEAVASFERRYFEGLLGRSRGNLSQVSRLAQMDRRYLYRVLERLGLLRPE